jgi:hypothetical protein
MPEPTIREQLKALPAGKDAAVQAMARSIGQPVDQKAAELLQVLHGEDLDLAVKAAGVLLELDARAFAAVLQGTKPDPIPAAVWDLQLLADIVLALRARLVKVLDERLGDKRDVPMKDDPRLVDEKPLPRRVCDEAYLMLRRLLSAEAEEPLYINSRLFLKLTIADRDAEIFFAKRERRFTNFSES